MKNWIPFKDKCPHCNSKNLEFSSLDPMDEQIRQDVHCNGCGEDFKIWTKTNWEVEVKKMKNIII